MPTKSFFERVKRWTSHPGKDGEIYPLLADQCLELRIMHRSKLAIFTPQVFSQAHFRVYPCANRQSTNTKAKRESENFPNVQRVHGDLALGHTCKKLADFSILTNND